MGGAARGQLPDLIGTGAGLTILGGALLASVYFSVPHRLTKPLQQWSNTDWSRHIEDLIACPHPGLTPEGLASMHLALGKQYFDGDEPAALKHYAAAIDLVSDQPDLLCIFGDSILRDGHVDLAISVYRRRAADRPRPRRPRGQGSRNCKTAGASRGH